MSVLRSIGIGPEIAVSIKDIFTAAKVSATHLHHPGGSSLSGERRGPTV
jgi:hypothetical protein